ncbi:ribonuclease HII [Pontimicrobium sp. IMCC45349]|uniref:ribonuclease HII n=1 Tax=Pontimicrobium sp. IMCC45349 TaxID=3391574 RepID=UPI00399F5BD7
MKKILLALLILIVLISCNNSKSKTTQLHQLIPENTSVVLKINDLEAFKSDIKNNALISEFAFSKTYKDLASQLTILEDLSTINQTYVCLNTSDNSSFTLITKYNDSLFTKDSLNIYSKIIDSIYVGSSSKSTLDKLQPNTANTFNTLKQVTNNNASFSVFFNTKSANALGQSIVETNSNLTKTLALDTQITPEQIMLNGIGLSNDSIPQLLNVFKQTIPQENTIQNIAPSNSSSLLSFTYNDFDILKENLLKFNNTTSDSLTNDELFQTINEVATLTLNNDSAIILKSIDASATKEALREHQNIVSTFRTNDIFEFNNSTLFEDTFTPLVAIDNVTQYIIIDDYFVFSASETLLQEVIANYQNATTLKNNAAYKDCTLSLSDESSLQVIANPSELKRILSSTFNEDLSNLKLNNYKISAIQFIQDDNFTHVNGIIKKNKTKAIQNSVSEEFNVTLDADLLTQPQFVINHRNKQKEIVVQDVNNKLYLISNSGKILWKKQLNGNILGTIEQVDLYKNGRLQLAFATPKRVYILDRNGKDVAPFPLKFNDEITQPLSVFDYDNRRDYRFLVTQKSSLLMYNGKGKSVNGFKYVKSKTITTQPKHFRINNKDYIVFAAGDKMQILNRQGKTRVAVNETINFSGNPIYRYKNQFTTTTSNGELAQVNQKGNVSKQGLGLVNNHKLTTTNKTLVTLSENKLGIKLKSLELDFGNYTAPKIFYINDKIYITVTDLQTQKVHLFDSQAKSIKNFPVYGNSTIDLNNIDKDRNLEFVVQGESNSIVLYQIN